MTYSSMAVNTAIERLIARDDQPVESARIVVAFGSSLKQASFITLDTYSDEDDGNRDAVSGYSPGLGNVSVSEEREKSTTPTEINVGYTKQRIGWYRLWKSSDGTIRFHHFWKSSVITRAEGGTPEEYCLIYDHQTLEPICFAIKRLRRLFEFKYLRCYDTYLEPIYGKIDRPSKYKSLNIHFGM